MADDQMVVVGGIRYRAEEAKRLGLTPDRPTSQQKTKTEAHHKMRKPKGGSADDTDDTPSAGEH